MNSIFTQIHTDRDGNETPLVSMDADHLVNTVNFFFKKGIENAKRQVMSQAGGSFAPVDMGDKQRRALGLKKLTPEIQKRIEEEIEDGLTELLHRTVESKWAYIVVGICRDDTRAGVVSILQDAFGVNGRVELPHLTRGAQEILELEDGFDFDEEPF